jgi:hypothetical protein
MPQTENDKTVELDVTGPGATVELPEVENDNDKTYDNKVKKNEANITYDNEPTEEKLYRKLLKMGLINKKITLRTLKSTLKALRKG